MVGTGGEEASLIFGIVWGDVCVHVGDGFWYVQMPVGGAITNSALHTQPIIDLFLYQSKHTILRLDIYCAGTPQTTCFIHAGLNSLCLKECSEHGLV